MPGSRSPWHSLSLLFAVTLAVFLVPAPGTSQECEKQNNPLAYQPRSANAGATYCEGFVEFTDVVGEEIYLVSLFSAYAPFGTARADPITILWSPWELGGSVHIRALGIPGRLTGAQMNGYRMDMVAGSSVSRFDWNPEFLQTQSILPTDIYVLGWANAVLEGIERDVYIPLSLFQGSPPARDLTVAGVWTNTSLVEARLTFAADGTGEPIEAALRSETLTAGTVIEFALPDLAAPGFYLGEMYGTTRDGVDVSAEFWIYLP